MSTMSTTEPPQAGSVPQTLPDIRSSFSLPSTQQQLLLHGKGQPYQVHDGCEIPSLRQGELLVEVHAIGLNPIDWKSAEFGFGLPRLPSLNGREFVGKIIASDVSEESSLKPGEWVLAISTDYRDFRKAAFQEFAIVCGYNAILIPSHIDVLRAAAVGVAYVAGSLALGVCLGVSFTSSHGTNFNLLELAQRHINDVPVDILPHIDPGIPPHSRPYPGEWILVYGGKTPKGTYGGPRSLIHMEASSVSAQIIIQLAKLAGLKVIGVANLQRHKQLLESLGTDLTIDRMNLDDAERDLKDRLPGSLRFAIDTVGSETASWCQKILASRTGPRYKSSDGVNEPRIASDDQSEHGGCGKLSHLVTLTGSPKTTCPKVQTHQVPIKLFHAHKEIGSHLTNWLHELLDSGTLKLPEVELIDGGLDQINGALKKLKSGSVSGRRLVVKTK